MKNLEIKKQFARLIFFSQCFIFDPSSELIDLVEDLFHLSCSCCICSYLNFIKMLVNFSLNFWTKLNMFSHYINFHYPSLSLFSSFSPKWWKKKIKRRKKKAKANNFSFLFPNLPYEWLDEPFEYFMLDNVGLFIWH